MNLYECQVEGRDGDNYAYTAVQSWIPSPPKRVNGILCIVLHPHGDAPMLLNNSEPWKYLAERHNFALVAVSFVGVRSKFWFRANEGTGNALLAAIGNCGKDANNLSFHKLPIVIAGVCAAGQFAYEFSGFAPKQTRAFVTIGGGKHDLILARKAVNIPALLIATPDRGPRAVANVIDLFDKGKKHSAPWQLGFETINEYDEGQCSLRVERFLEGALGQLSYSTRCGTNYEGSIELEGNLNRDNSLASFPSLEPQKKFSKAALSFEGKPIPTYALPVPATTDLGNLKVPDRGEVTKEITFRVESPPESRVDDISIAANSKINKVQVLKISPRIWNVSLKLDLSKIPLGPFNFELPIRFIANSRPLLGGVSLVLRGSISGDICVSPNIVFLKNLRPGERRTIQLRLFSKSGKSFNILEVNNSNPDWVTTVNKAISGHLKILNCDFVPPPGEPEVAGSFLIRVHSSKEQNIKVFYYGNFVKGSNNITSTSF